MLTGRVLLDVTSLVRVDIANTDPAVATRKLGGLRLVPAGTFVQLVVGASKVNVDIVLYAQQHGSHLRWQVAASNEKARSDWLSAMLADDVLAYAGVQL